MRRWIAGLCVLITACGGTTANDAAATHACSPLTEAAPATTLANVVGAGRDADGTLYVIDDGAADERVFVSRGGGALQRVAVIGAGIVGGDDVTVSTNDFSLRVLLTNNAPTKMGVLRGALTDAKTFEIGVEGDVLQIVGADAYGSLPVSDLQGVDVAYDAETADGHRLFVTHAASDPTGGVLRVFYGTKDAMLEREVLSVSRALSGSTSIAFTVDDVRYDAALEQAGGSLTFDGTTESLSFDRTTVNDTGAGLTFQCR